MAQAKPSLFDKARQVYQKVKKNLTDQEGLVQYYPKKRQVVLTGNAARTARNLQGYVNTALDSTSFIPHREAIQIARSPYLLHKSNIAPAKKAIAKTAVAATLQGLGPAVSPTLSKVPVIGKGLGVVARNPVGTYAKGLINPKLQAASFGLGAGIGKLTGQDWRQAGSEFAGRSVGIGGMLALTTPAMQSFGPYVNAIKNPAVRQAVGRGISSAANVGEGILVDRGTGMKTTPSSMALDAITGGLFAGSNIGLKKNIDVTRNFMQKAADTKAEILTKEIGRSHKGGVAALKDLTPSKYDSQRLLKRQIDIAKKEIKAGNYDPVVVDRLGNILDGHHRYAAYKSLGYKEVPIAIDIPKIGIGKFGEPLELKREINLIKEGDPEIRENDFGVTVKNSDLKGKPVKPGQQLDTTNPEHPFYNINRLNISNKQKVQLKEKIVGDFKPKLEKVVGKKMSADEIMTEAQAANDNLITTIGRQETKKLGAAQLRLRQTIAYMIDEGKINKVLLEKLRADMAFSANSARLMQQRGIKADPQTPNGKMLQEMLRDILKVDDDIKKIARLAEQYDLNNPRQAALFYRQFIDPTIEDWLDLVRYNSMLSSPNTHIINAVSNLQGTLAIYPLQRTIEGGIDAALSAVNPSRRRTRFAGEGVEYLKGYLGASKQAYRNVMDVLKGESFGEHPDVNRIPLTTGGKSQQIENALRVTTNALVAVDRFFKTLTQAGVERSLGYRIQKGVKVDDLNMKAQDTATELLFMGPLKKQGAGAVSNLIGSIGEWIKKGAYSDNLPTRLFAKFTLPFINIGTNLTKAGFEYNPITGTINLIKNEDKIAQLAKVAIGSAVTALAIPLAESDRLTFDIPSRNTRAGKEAQNAQIPPYSIKIGNTWVSYSKMHPAISWQLAMVAALTDAVKYKGVKEEDAANIMEGVWSWFKFGLDQTYYKNVSDLINGMEGDLGRFAAIPANYLSQFIPFRAFGSWLNRVIDQVQREPDKDANWVIQSLQQLAKQLPIASKFVPAKTDAQGEPLKKPNTLINLFSPYQTSPEIAPYGDQYRELRETQKDIRGYQQDQDEITEEQKTIQRDFLQTLKETPQEERAAVFREFAQQNPEAAKEILDRLKQDRKTGPTTPSEEYIKSQDVAVRSKYVLQSLQELKTVEERKALFIKWRQQGIITDEVLKDIVSRMRAAQTTTQ